MSVGVVPVDVLASVYCVDFVHSVSTLKAPGILVPTVFPLLACGPAEVTVTSWRLLCSLQLAGLERSSFGSDLQPYRSLLAASWKSVPSPG